MNPEDSPGSPEYIARGLAAIEGYLDVMGQNIERSYQRWIARFEEDIDIAEAYDLSWGEVFLVFERDA